MNLFANYELVDVPRRVWSTVEDTNDDQRLQFLACRVQMCAVRVFRTHDCVEPGAGGRMVRKEGSAVQPPGFKSGPSTC